MTRFPGWESNLRLLEYEAKFPTGGFTHLPKVNLFKTIYFSSYRFINFAICQKQQPLELLKILYILREKFENYRYESNADKHFILLWNPVRISKNFKQETALDFRCPVMNFVCTDTRNSQFCESLMYHNLIAYILKPNTYNCSTC